MGINIVRTKKKTKQNRIFIKYAGSQPFLREI